MHRLLTPADYRASPWKNGGGRTTEIAAHPAGAGLDRFDWRVSVAEVERDGPFSPFPGVERTLVLLSGAGMRLTIAGQRLDVLAAFEPIVFAGDAPVDCALVAGGVRDFNLMLRMDRLQGAVWVLRGEPMTVPPAALQLCFAAAGACECLVAGHPPLPLNSGHTFVDRAEEGMRTPSLQVNPCAADAVALVVVIQQRAEQA